MAHDQYLWCGAQISGGAVRSDGDTSDRKGNYTRRGLERVRWLHWLHGLAELHHMRLRGEFM